MTFSFFSFATTSVKNHINITAEQLNIVDLKAKDSYSLNSDDSGVLLRTIHTEGYVKESAVSAHIKTNGSLILNNQDVTDQLSLDGVMDTMTQMTGISGLELQQLQVTLAEDQEWEETTVMLSKMGTLIVQAVVSYLTAGMDGGLVSGLSSEMLNQAASMAIKSLTKQVMSGLLEAAITGNGLNLDLGDMARNALQAGVSVGLNMELASNIDAEGVVGFSLETAGQAGIQSLVYGTDFEDALASVAIPNASAKAFEYVGHDMLDDLGIEENSIEAQVFKTTTHGLVAGAMSELQGGDFGSVAIAAATSHVVSEYAGKELFADYYSGKISESEFQALVLAFSKTVGGASLIMANPDMSDEEFMVGMSMVESVSLNNSIDSFKELKETFKKFGIPGVLLEATMEGLMKEEYSPKKDESGKVVVENTTDALLHYYRGNGESVELGGYVKYRIETSDEVNRIVKRISDGEATHLNYNGADVDLTLDLATFHIGDTNLDYMTYEENGQWYVEFKAFSPEQDAFQDANEFVDGDDGHGSNKELTGGTTYNYTSHTWRVSIPTPPKKD